MWGDNKRAVPNTSFGEWGKRQEKWEEALLPVQKSTSGKAVSAHIKNKLKKLEDQEQALKAGGYATRSNATDADCHIYARV